MKPKVNWSRVRSPRDAVALILGTAFGAGLSPFAPGTLGTLVGAPLAFASASWSWEPRVALWLAILAIGSWAALEFDRVMASKDNGAIVIDEVLGFGIAAWTAGASISAYAVAFVAFRFFDIVKPFPVRHVDRWSKKKAGAWGGFGVMADDVVAGIQALACVMIAQWTGWLS